MDLRFPWPIFLFRHRTLPVREPIGTRGDVFSWGFCRQARSARSNPDSMSFRFSSHFMAEGLLIQGVEPIRSSPLITNFNEPIGQTSYSGFLDRSFLE